MKEIVGSLANHALVENTKGKLVGTTEIVLLLSEPQYTAEPGGGYGKTHKLETVRFAAGVASLKALAKGLLEACAELDDLEARASLKPVEAT